MFLKTIRGEAGDTIVEVMVVLAILGLALSICYATANRSLQDTRQAQENSIATAIAQSQIESLISLASNDSSSPNYIFQSGRLFCIFNGGVAGVTAPNDVFSVSQMSLLSSSGYSQYPASGSCRQQGLYNIAVAYNDPLCSNNCFMTRVTWDDIGGQGQDTVTLLYRLSQ